jgi:hypothetical protein
MTPSVRSVSVIDTFPAFERYWARARFEPIGVQIERWESEYMAQWPELLEKQKRNYAEEGMDWRRIARTRIFPRLPERLPRIRKLHRRLRESLPTSWSRSCQLLKPDFPVRFVIYVGIGVGAGWATRYGGEPACLFGLENAAEIASGENAGMPGSVAHEVAHLVHDEWRRKNGLRGLEAPTGPFWRLYEEGFATECERRVDGPRRFRLRTGRPDWFPWCTSHRAWLAATFLRATRLRRSVRRFFASWYNLRGQIECGYFLGAGIVREWAELSSLKEVALMPETAVRRRMRSSLRRIVEGGAARDRPLHVPLQHAPALARR